MTGLVKKGTGLAALKSAVLTSEQVAAAKFSNAVKQESLMICLDVSGSMEDYVGGKPKMVLAIEAANALIAACGPATAVGALAFSDTVHEVNDTASERPKLMRQVESFRQYTGGTVFASAIESACDAVTKSERKVKRMVLMTDGHDYSEFAERREAAIQRCVEKKVIIDTVGFGADADRHLLESIAKRTGGVYKDAKDAVSLVKAFLALEAGVRGLLGTGRP